jgi:hypothetical protein
MIEIIVPALQLLILGCLIIVTMRGVTIYQQAREAKRERLRRRVAIARCALSALDFMHKEGWLPDPTVGPEALRERRARLRRDGPKLSPKETSFHLRWNTSQRTWREHPAWSPWSPELEREHQLTVERLRDLSATCTDPSHGGGSRRPEPPPPLAARQR